MYRDKNVSTAELTIALNQFIYMLFAQPSAKSLERGEVMEASGYTVVTRPNVQTLVEAVNELIDEGRKPLGGDFSRHTQ